MTWLAADAEAAPAKINLFLQVIGRRDDGYHLLDSVVVFAGIGDVLTVSADETLSLAITGPFAAGLAAEPDNLVLRAARALAAEAGIPATGRLVLTKNLPVASGIGGGSADAAAALRLLCRFWSLSIDAAALGAVAGSLGADVPVCLAGRPARMGGIGEVLAPVPPIPRIGMVLINPGVAVSTPSVFRARGGAFSGVAAIPAEGWRDIGSLIGMLETTTNDLEPPARLLSPAIGDVLTALAETPGCRMARMSGSGATCFGLFDEPSAAHAAVPGLHRAGWWVWGGTISG